MITVSISSDVYEILDQYITASAGRILEGRQLEIAKLPSAISGDLRLEIGEIPLDKEMVIIEEFAVNVQLDLLVLVERVELVDDDNG